MMMTDCSSLFFSSLSVQFSIFRLCRLTQSFEDSERKKKKDNAMTPDEERCETAFTDN
jgi:hypothetical protein